MARPPLHNQHHYAVDTERLRHDDAVLWYGEMSCFVLWWSAEDHAAGLVDRCPVCFTPWGEITEVYQQAPKMKCDACYGTTFEGGFRALLYRPAIWSQRRDSEEVGRRGLALTESATIQPTTDFQMRDNDLVIRSDNSRWRIEMPTQSEISTGFGVQTGFNTAVIGPVAARKEDATSVVYTVPVNLSILTRQGWEPSVPYPTGYDLVNGTITLS